MTRIPFAAFALALLTAQASASAGFSCEADDNNVAKLVVEGATPRAGGSLINFGGLLELDGTKLEFKRADVKQFSWNAKGLQLRVTARSGDRTFHVSVSARRNPADEDDWAGSYEVRYGAAGAKDKAAKAKTDAKRGKVKCFME